MTPKAQRIAIAEACGWKARPLGRFWLPRSDEWAADATGLPNYLSDLNAMHEAEKVLTEFQPFRDELEAIVERDYAQKLHWSYEAVNATAAQRAKAFLHTLNFWTN